MRKGIFVWLMAALSLVARAQQPATAVPAPEPRIGSITGRVLTDDGQPLVKARVSVYKLGAKQPEFFNLTTDAEGAFAAHSLTPGVYSAAASMPAYVTPDEQNANAHLRLGAFVTLTLSQGGVITGSVYDESGAALVRANVFAYRLRTLTGAALNPAGDNANDTTTDDRGVYRFYGLPSGSYRMSAKSRIGQDQLPTYYPSTSRAAATEITVNAGSETGAIDIRLRKELGLTISGTVTGAKEGGLMSHTSVTARNLNTKMPEGETEATKENTFVLRGLTDGDYELRATTEAFQAFGAEKAGLQAASSFVRVSIRGASVSGVTLRMNSVASLKGRLTLEKTDKPTATATGTAIGTAADKCSAVSSLLAEAAITAHSTDSKAASNDQSGNQSGDQSGNQGLAVPNEQGEFTLRPLEAGQYHLRFDLPAPTWYVRTIAGLVGPAVGKAAPLPSDQFTLKPGQALDNIVATIAGNAARLQGRVSAIKGARLRIHLVPADTAQAEDLLRYDETLAASDGTFQFDHIAPGKYWLLAQAVAANEPLETQRRLQVWDNAARKQLRKDAELAAVVFEARPCSVNKDFKLEAKK